MTPNIRLFLTLVVLTPAIACDDTPTGPRPTAVLQPTAAPSPITPVLCPVSNCGSVTNQLEATTVITVRETAGVAGTIQSATYVLRRNSDNAVIVNATPSLNVRFTANGSVDVPVGVHWDRGQMTTASTLTVTINARDDNQHTVSTSMTIPVSAFEGSTP